MNLFEKCSHLHDDCPHQWFWSEELANAITHLLGMILGVIALIVMIIDAAQYTNAACTVVAVSIFGASLILSYGSSALYHFSRNVSIKFHLRKLDHICIFWLIAGSYTPFTLIAIKGAWGWSLFGTIWGMALAGTIFKFFFTHRWEWLSTLIYILMGWTAMIAIGPIVHSLPASGVIWLLLGGLSYTFGVFFFLMETIPFMHTVWHIFVLLGSLCHVFAVLFYVIPLT